jgi:hypothetical protein
MRISTFVSAIAFSVLVSGAAYAFDAAAPATPAADAAAIAAAKAKAVECSKQADAKGLHGAERRKVRADCKKAN